MPSRFSEEIFRGESIRSVIVSVALSVHEESLFDDWCDKSVPFAQRTVKFTKPRISKSAYNTYHISWGPPVILILKLLYKSYLYEVSKPRWKKMTDILWRVENHADRVENNADRNEISYRCAITFYTRWITTFKFENVLENPVRKFGYLVY